MKKFIFYPANKIVRRSLPSALLISFSVYLFARLLCYEFPMTWIEELIFFFKVMLTGSSLILIAIGGIRSFHFIIVKNKPRKKQTLAEIPNALFLKENSEYVQHTAYSN